jgi:hypothetical protein
MTSGDAGAAADLCGLVSAGFDPTTDDADLA